MHVKPTKLVVIPRRGYEKQKNINNSNNIIYSRNYLNFNTFK